MFNQIGEDKYTCVAPPGFEKDPGVTRAIQSFDPGVIPIWRLQLWRFPGEKRVTLVVHHGIGRYYPYPRQLRRPFHCTMPVGAEYPAPNFLDAIFEDSETISFKMGGPGTYMPWDWSTFYWCRRKFVTLTDEKYRKRLAARRLRLELEHRANVAELEARKREIEPWILRKLEHGVSDADWDQLLKFHALRRSGRPAGNPQGRLGSPRRREDSRGRHHPDPGGCGPVAPARRHIWEGRPRPGEGVAEMKVKKRRMWRRVNSQIFLWAGEEPKEIKYSGFRFKIPPRTETARKSTDQPGSVYKFESARDSKDRLIPGTIVVEDVITQSPSGGVHRVFDVSACCEYLQRDTPALFDQGFAIVSDVADIGPAMEEVLPLYEATQDKRAHKILQGEMERQAKMAEKGQIVTERENPHVVEWAMAHLARRGKTVSPAHDVAEIGAVLTGKARAVDPLPAGVPVDDTPKPEPASTPSDNKELYRECQDLNLRLNKRELEALVTGDDEQLGFIRSKLRAKREAIAAPA